MRRSILVVLAVVIFLAGCSISAPQQQEPQQQFVCPDGINVVTNLMDCPPYDKEYEECLDMPATSDYGPSARDECFYNLAFQRENISLCKKIMNDDAYYGVSQSQCGAELAMLLDDPTLCNGLGMLGKYGCYGELAVQLDDPTMCDLVSTASKKDDCLYDYLWQNEYYITDWTFCDEFSKNSDDKDYCYYSAASNTGSLSYCDKIEGSGGLWGNSQADCYASVASATYDPSVCTKLPTTSDIDDCYYSYAIYGYEQDACNHITDSEQKEDCLRYTNDSYYY
jgi:hypothetical protein